MKSRKNTLVTAGIPSLFLIFSVLVMVILALLTYGTSRSDKRLSSDSLEQTTAYYKATGTATDLFNDIRSRVLSDHSLPTEEELKNLAGAYPDTIMVSADPAASSLFYEIAFSDSQCLHVEVSYDTEAEEPALHIDVWDTRTTGSWDPDTTQHLFQGTLTED